MKTPRKGGWPWKLICRLLGWIVRMRMVVLKRREQTEDVKGEISDCEELLSFWAFQRDVREVYERVWKEPYPDGPVWPIKDQPILITEKTIVISKKEMDKSFREYERRLKEIRKDFNI
ncbi:MAG: hypothetical protein ACYC3G_02595 [Minisyncoccota bacterium]